jgi:hypothetical protein
MNAIRDADWYAKFNGETIRTREIVDVVLRDARGHAGSTGVAHELRSLLRVIVKTRGQYRDRILDRREFFSEEEFGNALAAAFEHLEKFEAGGLVMYQIMADLAAMDRSWTTERRYWRHSWN